MSDQMSPVEHITFEGRKNESVTLFLQNVKRIAFAEGRQRDQEWLADYVETCLAEKALEWYIALDQKIRYDFDALRVAMVERFRVVTPANLPPAPAAAAPPFTAPTLSTPSSSKPKPSQKRLGRITIPYPRARSPKNPDKESASRIWQLSEDTLELNINWEASGKGILTLELRANKEDTRNMWMRSAEDPDLEPSSKAKLYFEPL
ncbi:hypothetical protein FRB98_007765 [Tulasnella sp. 332]|nr:hypothetical protein FRB98_007765 [Tulasnella sp. 332]